MHTDSFAVMFPLIHVHTCGKVHCVMCGSENIHTVFMKGTGTVAQKCHGNFNFTTAISTLFTAISISSRQFQFHHGNFNFIHGNFNFITAISISPRQFQLRSRQFQLHHGNFNFTTAISTLFTAISISFTAISTSFTAISISSRQFQLCHGNFNFIFSRLTFPFPYLVLRVFLAI